MAHHDLNNKRLVSASVSEHLHVQAALADPSVDMKRKMQQPHGGGGGVGMAWKQVMCLLREGLPLDDQARLAR